MLDDRPEIPGVRDADRVGADGRGAVHDPRFDRLQSLSQLLFRRRVGEDNPQWRAAIFATP